MDVQKLFSNNKTFIAVIVILVAISVILYFFFNKENMEDLTAFVYQEETPVDELQTYASNDDVSPVDFSQDSTDITAADLLPIADISSEFSVAPGAPDLSAKNFLTAGFNIGINTQSSSNKNANKQLRSDPIIPVNMNATPFNQSTTLPDFLRKPLEIGGSA